MAVFFFLHFYEKVEVTKKKKKSFFPKGGKAPGVYANVPLFKTSANN